MKNINLAKNSAIWEDVAAGIKAAEGRATARTLTVNDVFKYKNKVENHLLAIPKKDLIGTIVEIDPNAQAFPNAYKYTPESTQFIIQYKRDGWYLTDIYRAPCKRPHNMFNIRLTDKAKTSLVEHLTGYLGYYDLMKKV